MAPIIIGLSGTTNSGKTSLCDHLEQVLPNLTVFHMDLYFHEEYDERHILLPEFNNYANWEIKGAVDFERLTDDVLTWKTNAEKMNLGQQPILIVEGIIIFSHGPLADLCDKKYFITLPKDECWERRRKRNYQPPEPEGYFDAICWPEYLKHMEPLHDNKDIKFVDGNISRDKLFSFILQDIKSALSTS